jgi:hypothetical protein
MGIFDAFTAKGQYARDVAVWEGRVKEASQIAAYVANPSPPNQSPVSLETGELLIANWGTVGVLEPRSSVVRDFGAVSHRGPGSSNTYYAGRSITYQGTDVPRIVDSGHFVITSQRLIFMGSTRTVEWKLKSFLGLTHSADLSWTAIHASGRMKLRGIQHGTEYYERFQFFIGLALAEYSGNVFQYLNDLVRRINDLRSCPPPKPDQVSEPMVATLSPGLTDPIWIRLWNGMLIDPAGAAPPADPASPSKTSPLRESTAPAGESNETTIERHRPVAASSLEASDSIADVREAISLSVGGQFVGDAFHVARQYVQQNAQALVAFDGQAGTSEAITPEIVAATRVVNSRISKAEADWLVEQGSTAPWHLLGPEEKLLDADPTVGNGAYDRASRLWAHFSAAAPEGVSVGKLSKVLYLMRPHFFPILDSRLRSIYRQQAAAAAKDVLRVRPGLGDFKFLYWEAVRRDLLSGGESLARLRHQLIDAANSGGPARQLVTVSDVRLLDILAWKTGSG